MLNNKKKSQDNSKDDILQIRHAGYEDLLEILPLYEKSRNFMAANGNPDQWTLGYPKREVLEEDIQNKQLYVGVKDEKIVLVFMFFIGAEPTYERIEGGHWLNEALYGTIHRISSPGLVSHGGDRVISWCYQQCCQVNADLRGDTHEKNLPMQHVFEKNGFIKCGTIYVRDGSPRIAYQKVRV